MYLMPLISKNWKKLVSLVLTAACTMVVTVAPVFADAASTPAYSPVEASTVDSLLSSSAQWVGQSLMTYSDDDLANMEASDQQFYARAAEAWEEAKADLGEVKSLEDGAAFGAGAAFAALTTGAAPAVVPSSTVTLYTFPFTVMV